MELEPAADPFLTPSATAEDRGELSREQERDHQRQTYRFCRLGFVIQAIALVLACFTSLLNLMVLFGGRALALWVVNTSWWHWIDAPIIWGSLVGAYLFWGRWKDRGWQRRAGLLLVMCLIDTTLWLLEHGSELGLREQFGHEWLREQLGQALGWAEFTLMASLACDFMAHLGVDQAPEAGKATRSLSATGAVIWMILFFERTAWNQGWPLVGQPIHTLEGLLLYMGSSMIWTITLIQVTALTIAAARQATRVLAEMDREDQQLDQFNSLPDTDVFFGADYEVSSRSKDDESSRP